MSAGFFILSAAISSAIPPPPQSHHDGLSTPAPSVTPAWVLGVCRSPLRHLGCHVRRLTAKVTSGDKRPQLESVRTPAPSPPLKRQHPWTLEESAGGI